MTVHIFPAKSRTYRKFGGQASLRRSNPEASDKLDVDFAYSVGVLARSQRQDVPLLYS